MNNIEKLKEILKQADSSSVMISKKQLENINIDELLTLNSDVIQTLNTNLADGEKLLDNELKFLNDFCLLSKASKDYLISTIEKSEIEMLKNIKDKIQRSIKIYDDVINKGIDIDVNSLLRKFESSNTSFITDYEINFIFDNIKERLDTASKIEILKEINAINTRIFNRYSILTDDAIINEESLDVTNVNVDLIKDLFAKYQIDFEKIPKNLKEKLSTYGDLKKMKDILDLLSAEDVLSVALKNFEIFVKTMLYSSADMINNIKLVNPDISFKELVRKIPTVLYPPVREIQFKGSAKFNPVPDTAISGSMRNYEKNSDLLMRNGINPTDVWNSCPSFFASGYKTIGNSITGLKIYGISLRDDEGKIRAIFSSMEYRKPSIIDVYDMALEAGAKNYALLNPSTLNSCGLYKFGIIKLAKKLGISDVDIFGTYSTTKDKIYLRKSYLAQIRNLPVNMEEIQKVYEEVTVNIPNKNIYDNIFSISNLNVILDIALNDKNIKALDQFLENDDMYNFNGTRVSRRKILRYYGALLKAGKAISMDSLVYCATINSMLDEEEFNNIYGAIKSHVDLIADDNISIINTNSKINDSGKNLSIGSNGGNAQ